MKKSKKRCLLLLVIISLLSLTACTQAHEQTGVHVLDNTDMQPEFLSFFSSTRISDNDVTKYWSEQFTEMYDKQVYINFEGASYYSDEGLSYRELLEKRLESSAPDDLYIINAEDVLEFEQKGYWMDLSGLDFVNNLSPAALYQSTYNGKVFSVPLSFTGFGFIWNVDLLTQHGLTIPQNREEFWHVCQTLKDAGILPYGANRGYALTVPAMCAGLSSLYGEPDQAEQIASLNRGETLISTYLRDGYSFLSHMIENGYLDPQQALDATPGDQDLALFLDGRCAFISATLGNLPSLSASAFTYEMTGIPALEDGCITVYGASDRLCVNPESTHLDTVLEFIEMVGTPEALARSAALDSTISSSNTISAPPPPAAQSFVALLQRDDQIPNQDFALHFNTWESIRDVAREICNGMSVDEACALLDEKQQADLQKYVGA